MKRDTTRRILLISYNYSPELTGIGKYNGEMMNWLAKRGYECSVLTAYPYYPAWRIGESFRRRRFTFSYEEEMVDGGPGKIKIYRCPVYVPAKPTAVKRILLDLSFLISAFLRLIPMLFRPRYDFVIAVAPSFQVGLLGVLYKKLKGAKLIYHVQDLQIEAARDLKMIRSEALVSTLLKAEDHVLHHADLVSSVSEEMAKRVTARAGKDTLLFPNWTNIHHFYPLPDRGAIKRSYGFSEADIIALYSGAMGEKQGLEAILHAAGSYREYERLKFVLCGSGPYQEKLRRMVDDMALRNVRFVGLQPREKFNAFLNMADIHLVIQKASASDLVMPSKLGAILSVGGVALVTANEGSSLHSLISKYNMGFLVDADDPKSLQKAIGALCAGGFDYYSMNARRYALDFLSIDKIMAVFEDNLRRLWRPGARLRNATPYQEFSSALTLEG